MTPFVFGSGDPGLINKGAPTIYFWKIFLKRITWNWRQFCLVLVGSANEKEIFTAPQWSCGKVMFLHLSVILFTVGGVDREPPLDREHPHPLDRDPPYGNERAVRILLEWILVKKM